MNYIKEHDYIFIDEYIDDGISGTTFERNGFKRLIEDAKNGRINTIITKDLSRLGRNSSYTQAYLDEFFPRYNIRFIAINDNVDTLNREIGDMETGIKNLFNEQYARDISKKVISSITTSKKNGKFLGGIAPYGYKKDETDKYKLVIDEPTAKIVRRIFDMFVNGYSIHCIAETLTAEHIPIPSVYKNLNRGLKSTAYGCWCTRTIGEILNNPTYIGNLTQGRRKKESYKSKRIKRTPKENWIIAENTHEPIIDNTTFNIAQNLLNKNVGKNCNDILLKGFLYCKECGHTISITKNGNGKYYCNCNYYKKHSKRGLCTPHSFSYQQFEDKILSDLKNICKQYLKKDKLIDIAKNSNKKEKRISYLENELIKVKNTINSYKRNLDEVYIDKLNKTITLEQFQRVNETIIKNIEKEKEYLNSLELEYNCLILNQPVNEDYDSIISDFLSFKKPSRQLIASLIDKIEIDKDKNVYINFKIKSIY